MKKIVLFIATTLIFVNVKSQRVNLGIKAGSNVSSVSSNSPDKPDLAAKAGFYVGFLAHMPTTGKNWAIQPEISYSYEGYIIKSTNIAKNNLGYLNLPVLAQYVFDNGVRVEAGPQIGFLLNATLNVSGVSVDDKNLYNKVAFSIPVGLGYLNRSSRLGFDARYNFGISNITQFHMVS